MGDRRVIEYVESERVREGSLDKATVLFVKAAVFCEIADFLKATKGVIERAPLRPFVHERPSAGGYMMVSSSTARQ